MNRNILFSFFLAAGVLSAAEYTVTPQDSLQKAVDRLVPGDVLTLRPGEYCQGTVVIRAKGTSEKPITIQGAHRNLSVVTAWGEPALKWSPVKGQRFVYEAQTNVPIFQIAEADTGCILMNAPQKTDMERFRGSFYYDAEQKKINVHCSDGRSPETHRMKYTVKSGHLFSMEKAEHLRLRNLTFTGSAHAVPRLSALGSAIRTQYTANLLIEDCDFLYNSGGVNITNHCRNTIVRNCVFHRNISRGYSEMAQLFFGSSCVNSLAENNLITDGQTHGLRFYSGAKDVAAVGNRIVNEKIGLYYKASAGTRLAERNVVTGCTMFQYSDLSGGRPIRDLHNTFALPSFIYDDNRTNLVFNAEKTDPKFCSPDNYDFRLQSDSAFFGSGAHPNPAPVYFVSPAGSDSNAGKSTASAFRSIQKALSRMKQGDTLYLLAGDYPETVSIPDGVTLCGHGKNPLAIIRSVLLNGTKNVTLKNLSVKELSVKNSSGIEFNRLCADSVQAQDSDQLVFFRATLKQCLFRNIRNSSAILSVLPEPQPEGFLCGYNSIVPLTAPGCQGWDSGAFERIPSLPEPTVADVKLRAYPQTAVVTWTTPAISVNQWFGGEGWWNSRPIVSYVEYGETPECRERAYSTGDVFQCAVLRGLKPGRNYYYRLIVPQNIWMLNVFNQAKESKKRNVSQAYSGRVERFTTPENVPEKGRVIYVDQNFSLSEAGKIVEPGDTVILRPGVYHDTFAPQASGVPGAPITLKAEKTGSVILDGSDFLRPGGVYLNHNSHIVVQGIIFRNFANVLFSFRGGMMYGQIQILNSDHITVRDCVMNGGGTYQFMIVVKHSRDIEIANNAFFQAVGGIAGGYNGNMTIRSNTFLVPLIRNIELIHGEKNSKITIRKNLFIGKSAQKVDDLVTYGELTGEWKIDFDENVWVFSPRDQKRFCGFEHVVTGAKTMALPAGVKRLREKTGFDAHGRETDQIEFKNRKHVDAMDPNVFRTMLIDPVLKGKINLDLEFFEPVASEAIGDAGARPVHP